jgi:hypothetical protein
MQHHRYESSGHSASMSIGHHGAFLGTAREKREKLLRKAYLNQQRHGTWQSHSPTPQLVQQSSPIEYRMHRSYPATRTHSADGISSSSSANSPNKTPAGSPFENFMPRTASQNSLNLHRASPCPSDVSFSFSNPKYFVRTAVLRPASEQTLKSPLHYENVIVSRANDEAFNRVYFHCRLTVLALVVTRRSTTIGWTVGRNEFSFAYAWARLFCSASRFDHAELVDRLTPTAYTTPEVGQRRKSNLAPSLEHIVDCLDYFSLSNVTLFTHLHQSDTAIQSHCTCHIQQFDPMLSGNVLFGIVDRLMAFTCTKRSNEPIFC